MPNSISSQCVHLVYKYTTGNKYTCAQAKEIIVHLCCRKQIHYTLSKFGQNQVFTISYIAKP